MAGVGKPSPGLAGRGGTQWIVLRLAGTEYVIRSAQIVQIEMVERITPIPNAPNFVRGVAYFRGEVVPVLDLRVRLGQPAVEPSISSRIIVIGSAERRVGLLVDAAREVVYLPEDELRPPPEAAVAGGGSHVVGVAVQNDRMLLVLDVEKVISAGVDLVPAPGAAPAKGEVPREYGGQQPDSVEQGGQGRATVSKTQRPETGRRSRAQEREG